MELNNNTKKPFIFSVFFLCYIPISEPRLGVLDIAPTTTPNAFPETLAMAPNAYQETPTIAPKAPLMAPSPLKKDFKEIWMEAHPPYAAPRAEKMAEIKKICSETDYASLCQSSVIPLFSANGGDKSSVLQLAIKAALAETTSAISDADSLAISPETDDDTVSSLDDCVSSYQSVLTDFRDAEAALRENDKGTLNSMLSSALSNIKSCTDGFDEPNPVAAKNEKLSQLISNCLAISETTK